MINISIQERTQRDTMPKLQLNSNGIPVHHTFRGERISGTTCTKDWYKSEAEAKAVVTLRKMRANVTLYAYQCKSCHGMWHITKKPQH